MALAGEKSRGGDGRPLVVVTGAAGDIGRSLANALLNEYRVVGLDREASEAEFPILEADLTSDESVARALEELRRREGGRIASVVHLAAYFDFTGEEHPLYEMVNVQGTRRLLCALQALEVEQFVFSSTMLVHRPGKVGERIDESTPLEPVWAYPRSKLGAEHAVREAHGAIPYVLLRLAGLYDEHTCVPTLAQQIARIFERDMQSRLYPGETDAGQAFVHRADMIDAFRRTIARRRELPRETEILIGETHAASFQELQDEIGRLIHGEAEWRTISVPHSVAIAGAWLQEKAEPLIPDAIDRGKPPFIRAFMIRMAQDHYALDVARARKLLDWTPRHDIREELPKLIGALKKDPPAWYKANRVTPPEWLEAAEAIERNPQVLQKQYEIRYRRELEQHRWAHLCNAALATWLITSPPLLGYESQWMVWSDVATGLVLLVLSLLSLSWRFGWARWACAIVGMWLLFAPIVFWAPTAAAYLNDTLVGILVIGFAVLTRPPPGVSPLASVGPTIPPGWSTSPSSWYQRLPIIVLAFVGLYVSRYLAAYQLGHVDAVWDPFFAGGPDPKNGTEEIITSSVSEAWPVSDAGVGAVTYALEILTGMIGSSRRWRTMPWLVILFGVMIVPLGVVSLTFIIIQPILIGTWCTLCLIAAAAMLLQIPYSVDEIVATGQFLRRRKQAGQSLLRVFFVGDTDETRPELEPKDDSSFERPLSDIVRESLSGGVGLPWNLLASIAIGVWLMFTRVTLGAEGAMANADHLIGSLVITVAVTAFAEIARPVRFVNMLFGLALLATPFIYDANTASTISGIASGLALIALSVRRGPIRQRYGGWDRLIV